MGSGEEGKNDVKATKVEKAMASAEAIWAIGLREETKEIASLGGKHIKIKQLSMEMMESIRKECTVDGVLDEGKLQRLILIEAMVEPAFTRADYDNVGGMNIGVYSEFMMAVNEVNDFMQTEDAVKNA